MTKELTFSPTKKTQWLRIQDIRPLIRRVRDLEKRVAMIPKLEQRLKNLTQISVILCALCSSVAFAQPAMPVEAAATVPDTNTLTMTLGWRSTNATGSISRFVVYTNAMLPSVTNRFALLPTNKVAATVTNTATNASFVVLDSPLTIQVVAVGTNGLSSMPSATITWPKPTTNIITIVSVWGTNLTHIGGTNWSVTLTNPAGTKLFRHDIKWRVE